MQDNIEIKNVFEDSLEAEEIKFKYNFINEPWDDRTKNSKIGILALLAAIFMATIAFVLNNVVMHYMGADYMTSTDKTYCNLVKADKYLYVARILSASSVETKCVAAVISPNTVLANNKCQQARPIRFHLGSVKDPRCKKDFFVDAVDTITQDDSISLVLLTTFGNTYGCIETIDISSNIDSSHVHIIGKPNRGDKTLSLQMANIVSDNSVLPKTAENLNRNNTIWVETFTKCSVRVGDLLLQHNKILGIAFTGVHKNDKMKIACFVKLTNIRNTILKEIEKRQLMISE